MEMQDNEFDDLFRSKLEGFEIEPSVKVWPGIAGGLSTDKRKKLLMPFLSIAASIIVLITAGILFIPQNGKKITKPIVKPGIAKTNPAPVVAAQAKINSINDALKASRKENKELKSVNRIVKVATDNTKIIKAIPVENAAVTDNQKNRVKTVEQPSLASLSQKADNKDVVSGNETKLIAKQPVEEKSVFITKPVLIAEQIPVQNKPEIVSGVKPKHNIHTLGDLINVVVATVDKRKDKVIEFTNKDDEDEATVTGVNLGIIKFKKEK